MVASTIGVKRTKYTRYKQVAGLKLVGPKFFLVDFKDAAGKEGPEERTLRIGGERRS